MKTAPHFIDGHEITEGARQPKRSPIDGRWLAELCVADDALMDGAVQSARRALFGPWGDLGADERGDLLERIGQLVDGLAREQCPRLDQGAGP